MVMPINQVCQQVISDEDEWSCVNKKKMLLFVIVFVSIFFSGTIKHVSAKAGSGGDGLAGRSNPRKKSDGVMAENRHVARFLDTKLVGTKPTFSELELGKIVDGEQASIKDFPWLVIIHYKVSPTTIFPRCCGAIIRPRWVLTAASCLGPMDEDEVKRLGKLYLPPSDFYISYGTDDAYVDSSKLVAAIRHVFPTEWNRNDLLSSIQNTDIALIELSSPIKISDTPGFSRTFENIDRKHCVILGYDWYDKEAKLKKCNITDFDSQPGNDEEIPFGFRLVDVSGPGDQACRPTQKIETGSPVVCLNDGSWHIVGIPIFRLFFYKPGVTFTPPIPGPPKVAKFYLNMLSPWRNWIDQVIGRAFTAYEGRSKDKEGLTYTEAVEACKNKSGFLAKPQMWRDQKAMADATKHVSGGLFWIGFRKKTGTNWEFTGWNSWATGQPDNQHDCVAQRKQSKDTPDHLESWDDRDCNTRLDYVCQFSTSEKRPLPYQDTTCCSQYLDMRCGDLTVSVVRASYGRQYINLCVTQDNVSTTQINDVTANVAQRCNGQNSCTFQLKKIQDEECKNNRTYLEVTYHCIGPNHIETTTKKTTSGVDNRQASVLVFIMYTFALFQVYC